MNDSSSAVPEQLQITWEALRSAIGVYLALAYPSGSLPETVRRRTLLDEQRPLREALNGPPFEQYAARAPFQCTVCALRLGSADYPNLKMEIRPFPHPLGFVFWVNTHDDFVPLNSSMRDADQWRELVLRNRALKQSIERAWARPSDLGFGLTLFLTSGPL
jgi:hypothetical protein